MPAGTQERETRSGQLTLRASMRNYPQLLDFSARFTSVLRSSTRSTKHLSTVETKTSPVNQRTRPFGPTVSSTCWMCGRSSPPQQAGVEPNPSTARLHEPLFGAFDRVSTPEIPADEPRRADGYRSIRHRVRPLHSTPGNTWPRND